MPEKQDALIGHQVGRYMIDALVREDRLGKVYAATDVHAKRKVDVKVLDPAFANSDEHFARFGREMLATATINHPNTVAMLDFGDHRKLFHYIVLEHVDAITVADEIAEHGKIAPERVARIAHQVAGALAAAHAENVIHRNLCPSNLLLLQNADGDFVKIRDFGLSRLVAEDENDSMVTASGVRVGNPAYMAPEYITAAAVHARGDLYSLGVVMYEMLVGKPPYTGTTTEIYEQQVSGAVPKVSATVRAVPPWLDDLVFKLMQKEMFARPASAADVAIALERGLGGQIDLPILQDGPIVRRTTIEAASDVTRIAIYFGFGVIVLAVVGLSIAAALLLTMP